MRSPSRLLSLAVLVPVSACGLVLDLDPAGASSEAPVEPDGGLRTPDGSGAGDAGDGAPDAERVGDGGASLDGSRDAATGEDAAVADGGRPQADGSTMGADAGRELPVGERCSEDVECASGFCYDVSLSNPFCFGRVCTISCTDWTDCDEYAAERGGHAAERSCVRHSRGDSLVCDFSWGHLPGAEIACE